MQLARLSNGPPFGGHLEPGLPSYLSIYLPAYLSIYL